ncbi:hypothetical protein B0H19DRAFT_1271161 [Mycena capillaripes]|nr:hypothetical protein B0H19DRAFT_1271161 [Mycena capillaripes]
MHLSDGLDSPFLEKFRVDYGNAVSLRETLYQPDGAIGACENPIQDSDFALALPPNHWSNGTFCGITVPVMMANAPNNMFNATVQDFCTTCVEKQIELTPAGFHALIGLSPGDAVEVFYILPHK